MDRRSHEGEEYPFLGDPVIEGDESVGVDHQPFCSTAKESLDILKPSATGNKNSGSRLDIRLRSRQEHAADAFITGDERVAQAGEGGHAAIP